MKKLWSVTILMLLALGCSKDSGTDSLIANPQPENVVPCQNGMADIYPCKGYDLLGKLSLREMDATSANDIWGWTDSERNREYALVGLNNGVAFVDITQADKLVYLGKLPAATGASSARDIKVYKNHAFVVAETSDHGMQVFDLTQLGKLGTAPQVFSAVARYTGFGNSHNLHINETTGYAYAVGTARDDAFNGGVHFINIQDPKNPVGLGGYGEGGYCHDAQVVIYNGPDTDYSGREILFGANEDKVVIVDVTDKGNPLGIASFTYADLGYTHQGWLSEDHRYFLLGDEADESRFGYNTRSLIFDFSDLDAPVLHHAYLGKTRAVDHNGYVLGNEFFLANYAAGMRVLNIAGIGQKEIIEQGYFDTYAADNSPGGKGAWTVYPYFKSKKIIVNDINSGLFIVKKSE
ncbi:choice-of-anchor B domain-containing protein [Arenibacter nanhaiticus]|uniref:Choice-of-anchor B domain-containing protein n=1 Tax=Arenibacter nanhaiticus TaxID=558155 RepID=A0A1M6A9M0_9FLAO|nr:choice-of-anchor B family protein [Arenibacter nanhaiticus]SHI33158.1 choice-of-anchor B domain-containing protein [Arenibacter nanhaiticus]